jgi:hypothetical protein
MVMSFWMLALPQTGQLWEANVDLGFLGLLQRFVHVVGPAQRVAHLGAAHGEQVVHLLAHVLCAVVQLLVREC